MRTLFRWYRAQHLAPLMLLGSVLMLLAGAAVLQWSPDPDSDTDFASLARMRGAYERVVPGRTSEGELLRLGFDRARYRARIVSGAGVQEYFMPASSAAFDRMNTAVRSCFDARDRCQALVFPLAAPQSGLMAAEAEPSGRMIFLLRDGRVTFKAMQPS